MNAFGALGVEAERSLLRGWGWGHSELYITGIVTLAFFRFKTNSKQLKPFK